MGYTALGGSDYDTEAALTCDTFSVEFDTVSIQNRSRLIRSRKGGTLSRILRPDWAKQHSLV